MEQANLSDIIAALTSNLTPSKITSNKQLEALKFQLLSSLQVQDIQDILPGGLNRFDRINLQAKFSNSDLPSFKKTFINETKNDVIPEGAIAPSGIRVFRREVPVRTSQYAASVPKWASGQAVNHTLGPFKDNLGKLFWFDFYRRVHYVKVARGTDIFLQVPILGFLSAHQHYTLPAGSVWLRSQLITPSAPTGAYTGLKIKGGEIIFKNPVSISGSSIIIAGGDICELSLDLDQPIDTPSMDSSTGEDAKNQNIELPKKIKIVCNISTAIFSAADDMSLDVYGKNYKFSKENITPSFEPILNRILISFKCNLINFSAPVVKSTSFQLIETAPITGNYWALSVTVSAINLLGESVGVGAIVIKTKQGLKADWRNLEKGPALLNTTYIMSEPGRISVTSIQAASGKASQKYELWEENNPTKKVRSVVDLQYGKQFIVLYNCLSEGNETLIILNAAMQARVDCPLTADKNRLKINALSATIVFLEIKDQFWIYLIAQNMMQQFIAAQKAINIKPISFALSNALIKTTPVDDFYLFGKLTTQNEINEGTVAMNCPMYFLLPSLPDPYVSNYQPFGYRGRDNASQSLSRISFAPVVQWVSPAAPKLLMLFVPDNTSSDILIFIENNRAPKTFNADTLTSNNNLQTSTAANFVSAKAFFKDPQKEDADNTAGLREIFNKNLNLGNESIFMLDVSTNADLFGVGLGFNRSKKDTLNPNFPLAIIGMDLVTDAFNTRIYTLPQIQWEPLWTIQNPDVAPYPFPSPVTSPDTGDPTIIGTQSFDLVPIAPKPVIDKFLSAYNDKVQPKKMAALFSLPFGMKAAAVLDNASDTTKPGAEITYNRPDFTDQKLTGGLQITVLATSPLSGLKNPSASLKGATFQTRNLINLFGGNIPLNLSVLGTVVDTIFNGEFSPTIGKNKLVPLERMDFSGYGATIFSNWLDPTAAIAATSQARFDVLIGRTSHEVIQVKSILYPWGIAVVRTITIQRTSGGGVTRYDSGWKAQGPGVYDFSFTDAGGFQPNPLEFHPGIVKGIYNVTEIRDTGRIYPNNPPLATNTVIMQEVFFNGDVLIEDVALGAFNGFVPSKKQRGFIQLAPYQKVLTPQQFRDLIVTEGELGGPVDCVVNVGQSKQNMRVVRVDVSTADKFGTPIFVTAGHGSLALPKEGAWSQVKRQESSPDIVVLNEDGALPIIREGILNTATTHPYRFADPADILVAANPKTDYALLHSTGSQKVLFLRPTIDRNDTNIKSIFHPYFADSYAISKSKGIFPDLTSVFPLGGGGTILSVLGNNKLHLTSGGNYNAPNGLTRDLLKIGDSRIYIDYSNVGGTNSDVAYSFDSNAAIPWAANMKNHTIVVDLLIFKSIISVTTDFSADFTKRPDMGKPKLKFGSVLEPVVEILSFLGDFNMASAFKVLMGNATTDSWEPKFKAALTGLEISFEAPQLEIKVFGKTVSKTGVEVALPPLKLKFEMGIEAHYNMLPFSFTSNDPALSSDQIALAAFDMLSIGAALKFGGEIYILCFAISPTLGLYFVGIIELEFGFDSKDGKNFSFKVAVGLELATVWPIVGKVSLMMAIGLEMEFKDSGNGIFAIMIFKGEAELLEGLIQIGISIEAKGGQEKEAGGTFAVVEVEFAAEVSLAWVIHFEFDVTWQERKQIA